MREIRADRGRHDNGERRAETELHTLLLRHVEHAKHLVEYRHDDEAAAHSEQSGEQARDDGANDDRMCEPHDFVERNPEDHARPLTFRPVASAASPIESPAARPSMMPASFSTS